MGLLLTVTDVSTTCAVIFRVKVSCIASVNGINKSEGKNDDAFTRRLRTALNVPWRDHISNQDLYGHLPKLSSKIREKE